MEQIFDGGILVKRSPSIYTNRKNNPGRLQDVRIMRRSSEWGGKHSDGHMYITVVCLAAEDGTVLRNFGPLPPPITPQLLLNQGFIDKLA
jgi:hypothetical protein